MKLAISIVFAAILFCMGSGFELGRSEHSPSSVDGDIKCYVCDDCENTNDIKASYLHTCDPTVTKTLAEPEKTTTNSKSVIKRLNEISNNKSSKIVTRTTRTNPTSTDVVIQPETNTIIINQSSTENVVNVQTSTDEPESAIKVKQPRPKPIQINVLSSTPAVSDVSVVTVPTVIEASESANTKVINQSSAEHVVNVSTSTDEAESAIKVTKPRPQPTQISVLSSTAAVSDVKTKATTKLVVTATEASESVKNKKQPEASTIVIDQLNTENAVNVPTSTDEPKSAIKDKQPGPQHTEVSDVKTESKSKSTKNTANATTVPTATEASKIVNIEKQSETNPIVIKQSSTENVVNVPTSTDEPEKAVKKNLPGTQPPGVATTTTKSTKNTANAVTVPTATEASKSVNKEQQPVDNAVTVPTATQASEIVNNEKQREGKPIVIKQSSTEDAVNGPNSTDQPESAIKDKQPGPQPTAVPDVNGEATIKPTKNTDNAVTVPTVTKISESVNNEKQPEANKIIINQSGTENVVNVPNSTDEPESAINNKKPRPQPIAVSDAKPEANTKTTKNTDNSVTVPTATEGSKIINNEKQTEANTIVINQSSIENVVNVPISTDEPESAIKVTQPRPQPTAVSDVKGVATTKSTKNTANAVTVPTATEASKSVNKKQQSEANKKIINQSSTENAANVPTSTEKSEKVIKVTQPKPQSPKISILSSTEATAPENENNEKQPEANTKVMNQSNTENLNIPTSTDETDSAIKVTQPRPQPTKINVLSSTAAVSNVKTVATKNTFTAVTVPTATEGSESVNNEKQAEANSIIIKQSSTENVVNVPNSTDEPESAIKNKQTGRQPISVSDVKPEATTKTTTKSANAVTVPTATKASKDQQSKANTTIINQSSKENIVNVSTSTVESKRLITEAKRGPKPDSVLKETKPEANPITIDQSTTTETTKIELNTENHATVQTTIAARPETTDKPTVNLGSSNQQTPFNLPLKKRDLPSTGSKFKCFTRTHQENNGKSSVSRGCIAVAAKCTKDQGCVSCVGVGCNSATRSKVTSVLLMVMSIWLGATYLVN